MSADQTRIDRWMWAVRLYKTRALASEACRGGHVELNGNAAKPSSNVRPGDRVKARVGARVREVEVTAIIEKRVGAQVAAECLVDHTPAPKRDDLNAPVFQRDARAGRPTKRDRRELDRFRSRVQDEGER